MPFCKNCNERISKLDKDICPFCGTLKPLEGVDSKTTDITQAIDPVIGDNTVQYKHKSKKILFLLSLIGPFGGPFFYLGYPKTSLFIFASTIFIVGGTGLILGLTNLVYWWLAFLIPFVVLEIIHIVLGLVLLTKNNLKDKKGRFIR